MRIPVLPSEGALASVPPGSRHFVLKGCKDWVALNANDLLWIALVASAVALGSLYTG